MSSSTSEPGSPSGETEDDSSPHLRWLHVFLDVSEADVDATASFWTAVLGWPLVNPWSGHPEFRSFGPPDGQPYVHMQTIDGPARIHVDLAVENLAAEQSRLTRLGACVGPTGDWWQVMASPGGLPFCLVADKEPMRRPEAVRWPQGHRTRLVQLCIDSPEQLHDRETSFWREATGWEARPADRPEFGAKLYPPEGGPVQILLQRLGSADGAEHTSAHIDLGTDDIATEVARLDGLGAQWVAPGHGWVVLRDPAGLLFCVTGNPPG